MAQIISGLAICTRLASLEYLEPEKLADVDDVQQLDGQVGQGNELGLT